MIIRACIKKILLLKSKPLGKTIVMALLCGIIFIVTKNVTFAADTIAFFNFTAIAFGAAILYQSIKDKHIYELQLTSVLAIAFILNNYLNANVFFYTFHVELKYFLMSVGAFTLVRILLPPLISQINKSSTSINQKSIPTPDKKEQPESQKGYFTNFQGNTYFEEHPTVNENAPLENKKRYPVISEIKTEVKKIGLEIKKVVFVLILLLPTIFLTIINLERFASMFSDKQGENIQFFGSFGASFILVTLLWTILWGGIMSAVLWMASTLKKIWEEREKEFSGLIIYTGAFMVIVLFLSQEQGFSIDKVADMLVAGELLSYPVVLIVIFPIFMLTMITITELIQRPVIKETGKEIGKLLLKMAKDSLISIIKFLQFVSSDFLVSITELVEDDIEYPDSVSEEGSLDITEKDEERYGKNNDRQKKMDQRINTENGEEEKKV